MTSAAASVSLNGQKYIRLFSMPDGKLEAITSCQSGISSYYRRHSTHTLRVSLLSPFTAAICDQHLHICSHLRCPRYLLYLGVNKSWIDIPCCFRTDANKLRLPLGPPISSLSQGVRSSMEHKVGISIMKGWDIIVIE